MVFTPRPLDTSTVGLDAEILELTELLARHTHDIWAQQRLDDGWRYGPSRNDDLKEHPHLIPYEDLPDSEKEYDRKVSQGTLKAILALGFRITKG